MQHLVMQAASPHTFDGGAGGAALAGAFQIAVMKRLRTRLAAQPSAQALWDTCRLGELKLAADVLWWQPEIGVVLKHLGQAAMLEAVMQLLLALHARGIGARWHCVLGAPERFSMGGHVFELYGAVTVEASARRVVLTRANLSALALLHGAHGWRLEGGAPIDAAWRYSAPCFLQSDALAHIYLQRWDGAGIDANAQIVIDWPRRQSGASPSALRAPAAALEDALALLDQADPAYLAWIAPMLRGVCATPMVEPDQHNSGSNIFHAGIVSCGFPLNREALAEAIVHEVSHQHFLLLNSVIPLVRNGHDDALYYSSLKRQHRPLYLILLAFHASANMSLLWCDLLRRSAAPRYSAELGATLAHTRSLARHLHGNAQLSDAGVRLFQTQAALLRRHGHEICPAPVPAPAVHDG
ncbi:aKG-HExxH-type peptide beta-hydroxylase [Massilia sp. TSP1-1-2]|uniref:aKG-HExxH-type peptide beta-hydroxylase n=1 Tax=Massilia sp. TSP1-1-2 TaxID=2804649 RepID=UPI003CEE6F19